MHLSTVTTELTLWSSGNIRHLAMEDNWTIWDQVHPFTLHTHSCLSSLFSASCGMS